MSAALALATPAPSELASEQLVAFASDRETAQAIAAAVGAHYPAALIHEGGISAALSMFADETAPSLIIADVTGVSSPPAVVRTLLDLCPAKTRLLVIGTENDVALYRSVIAAGAIDYLVKPFEASVLITALERGEAAKVVSVAQAPAKDKGARVIFVIGAREGVGASTVALNLAWVLSEDFQKTAALVDLDLHFGTILLSLDLEPSRGLREALESPDRIDNLFVASAITQVNERFYVFGAEEPLEEGIAIDPHALGLLLKNLPGEFDYVVIDVPARVAIANPRILEMADTVALVANFTLPSLRDSMRLMGVLRNRAQRAPVVAIGNLEGAFKTGVLKRAEFERGLGMPVRHVLPFDGKGHAATNNGRILAQVNRKSKFVAGLRRAAVALAGETLDKPRLRGLSALFSRRRK